MSKAPDLLSLLRQKVAVDKDGGNLVWLHDGRGSYMRAGKPVSANTVVVGKTRISYQRAAWMLLTGQNLTHDDVIDTSADPSDYRKWRRISRKQAGLAVATAAWSGGSRRTLVLDSWIDFRGKTVKPKVHRGSAEGFDPIDQPGRNDA